MRGRRGDAADAFEDDRYEHHLYIGAVLVLVGCPAVTLVDVDQDLASEARTLTKVSSVS